MASHVCSVERDRSWSYRKSSHIYLWCLSNRPSYCHNCRTLCSVSISTYNIEYRDVKYHIRQEILKGINVKVHFSKLTSKDLFIKCGEWDTQKDNEPKGQQTRSVKQISLHPAFRRRGVHNDLAVVHVNSSFELDDHINPICLPTSKVCHDYH